MKLIVWMMFKIFRMLNQFAAEIPTTQSTNVIPTSSNSWKNAKPFYKNAEPQRRAAKDLEHTWCIGKRFCESACIFISSLSSRIESMVCNNWGAAPFIHSGEKWKARTKSRSKMPVWTVSQRFRHLQWRRLFKESWSRPYRLQILDLHFDKIPFTSNVCLLEDKVQDRGMYLFTIFLRKQCNGSKKCWLIQWMI